MKSCFHSPVSIADVDVLAHRPEDFWEYDVAGDAQILH
jgi:hypothetical protein